MTSQSYSRLLPSERVARETFDVSSVEIFGTHADGGTEFNARTGAFYEKCAEVYDWLYPDHLCYSRALFESLLPLFRQHKVQKVLDASCGVGHDMSCLLRHGFQVDGIDVSKTMLAGAGRRLSAAGWQGFSLRQGDVRALDAVVEPGSYDLVIFRGNTFSNVRPHEIPRVIRNLSQATRSGGLLCLDYRNGYVLMRERKSFEFRGIGFDPREKLFYLSFYTLGHTRSIEQTYKVRATVMCVGLKHGVRVDRFEIRSHYVDPDRVLSAIESNSCQILLQPKPRVSGLPRLQNLVCLKPT